MEPNEGGRSVGKNITEHPSLGFHLSASSYSIGEESDSINGWSNYWKNYEASNELDWNALASSSHHGSMHYCNISVNSHCGEHFSYTLCQGKGSSSSWPTAVFSSVDVQQITLCLHHVRRTTLGTQNTARSDQFKAKSCGFSWIRTTQTYRSWRDDEERSDVNQQVTFFLRAGSHAFFFISQDTWYEAMDVRLSQIICSVKSTIVITNNCTYFWRIFVQSGARYGHSSWLGRGANEFLGRDDCTSLDKWKRQEDD